MFYVEHKNIYKIYLFYVIIKLMIDERCNNKCNILFKKGDYIWVEL